MKQDQAFTPKYWVFHNTKDTDVFLDTADKSLGGCGELAKKLHPKAFDKYECYCDYSDYTFSLIEIKIIEVK